MTTYVLADGWESHVDELAEWAAANGLDADLIPSDTPVEVNGDLLTVREVVVDPEKGGHVAAQYIDNRPVTRARTVPLTRTLDPALWARMP